MSQRYQSFLFIVFGVFVVNLFSMNSYTPVWSDAETASLEGAKELLFQGTPPNFASAFVGFLEFRWEDVFINRLPGAFLLILGFFGIYAWGKKIFGKQTILNTLVVLASSFLVVNVAKFATSDAWLFCFQVLSVLALLLFLKQPTLQWNIWHGIFVGLGLLVHPISTLVLTVSQGGLLMIFHKNGKRLLKLYFWLVPALLVGISYAQGFPTFETYQPFFISYETIGAGNYFLWLLYGILPWFAFLPAGMRHVLKQFRKQEELSIIVLSILVAGMVSMSLVPQFVFALIIAKQVKGFFEEKYPYDNLIKLGAVLHLLVVMVGAMILMIGGWQELKGIGFRTMMVISSIYWICSLAGVIGVYGKNRRVVIGSAAVAGLFVTFLFWGQVFPLLEEVGMF